MHAENKINVVRPEMLRALAGADEFAMRTLMSKFMLVPQSSKNNNLVESLAPAVIMRSSFCMWNDVIDF